MDKGFWRRFGTYSSPVIALVVVVWLIFRSTPQSTDRDPIVFGYSLPQFASIVETGVFATLLIIALISLIKDTYAIIRFLYINYIKRPVGRHQIDERARETLLKGLRGQLDFLSYRSCWPTHDAAAKAADAALRIDFGDAVLTTPHHDLETIQAFLTHSLRADREIETNQSVLIIKGEPGAGKSILTQEIHASLVRGIEAKMHSLIPFIIYAADLSVDDFASFDSPGTPFQKFLDKKLRRTNGPEDKNCADFVAANWNNHDFVILIDGLDEIAQRQSYFEIQQKLKELVWDEIRQSGQRVRRFIMSCRTHDDVHLYDNDSPFIVLKGLATSEERDHFCEKLIARSAKGDTESRRLLKALQPDSAELTSHDLFRRNPYFLTLLIEYHNGLKQGPVSRQTTFEHIMNEHIRREAVRATRSYGSEQNPNVNSEALFSSTYQISSIVLKYMAGFMSAHGSDSALYNQINIDHNLTLSFQSSIHNCLASSASMWKCLRDFGTSFNELGSISDDQISDIAANGVLDESDMRIIRDSTNDADASLEQRINSVFGTIPRYVKQDDASFYGKLATYLARLGQGAASSPSERLWLLLFARGLAGAHSLRLVYVDWVGGVPQVKFRHRRLAEYFAACYFRDRWPEKPWKVYSPWHTPVFNLVAAIEGERCLAFELVAERVGSDVPDHAYAWRSSLVDAAEIAAFAERGDRFAEIVRGLLERMATAMKELTKKDRSKKDIASQFSIINALGFIGDLGVGRITQPQALTMLLDEHVANLPAPFFLAKIRAASAIEKMGSRSRSLDFRLRSMWDLISYPNALTSRIATVRRSGGMVELLGVLLLYVLAELSLVMLVLGIATAAVLATLSESSQYDIRPVLLTILTVLFFLTAIQRFLQWRTSPSTARLVSAAFIYPFVGSFYAIVYLLAGVAGLFVLAGKAVMKLITSFPQAMKLAGEWIINLVKSIPRAVRELLRICRLWLRNWRRIAMAMIWISISVGAVYSIALFGYSTWQRQRAESKPPQPTATPSTPPVGQNEMGKVANEKAIRPTTNPKIGTHCLAANAKASEVLAIASRKWRTAAELGTYRRELAVSVPELISQAGANDCIDWWGESKPSAELAYARIQSINIGASPLPIHWEPSFTMSEFDRLKKLLAQPLPKIGTEMATSGWLDLSGWEMFQLAGQAENRASQIELLSTQLKEALRTGQITNLANGSPPNDEQFHKLVTEAMNLTQLSTTVRKSLRHQASSLYERAQALFFRLLMVLGLLAFALFVVRKLYVDRRDNTKIGHARGLNFEGLIEMIRTQELSDRVRLKLVHLLREQPAGEEIANAIEELAQMLGASGKRRDIDLSIELARAAGVLSARTRG